MCDALLLAICLMCLSNTSQSAPKLENAERHVLSYAVGVRVSVISFAILIEHFQALADAHGARPFPRVLDVILLAQRLAFANHNVHPLALILGVPFLPLRVAGPLRVPHKVNCHNVFEAPVQDRPSLFTRFPSACLDDAFVRLDTSAREHYVLFVILCNYLVCTKE